MDFIHDEFGQICLRFIIFHAQALANVLKNIIHSMDGFVRYNAGSRVLPKKHDNHVAPVGRNSFILIWIIPNVVFLEKAFQAF
jgi:hypothetical protein